MEEKPTITTTSKEHVAYKLAEKVFSEELIVDSKSSKHQEINTDFRKYYLDLYAECLEAAKNCRVC